VVEACEGAEDTCEEDDCAEEDDAEVVDAGADDELDAPDWTCAVVDWLVADVTGGSWSCCWVVAWLAPALAATSKSPVAPTARSVVVAIAVLRNSRLFKVSRPSLGA
jgi:hypothetical protein